MYALCGLTVRGLIRQKRARLKIGRQRKRSPSAHANSPSTSRIMHPTRSFDVDMDHPLRNWKPLAREFEVSLLGLRLIWRLGAQEKSPRGPIRGLCEPALTVYFLVTGFSSVVLTL